ncbi:MAG: hypothetical protein JWR10_3847, partial [Rubritepida sp.]|nr:hypothetical protein [Rubritepida sp.]
MRLKTSGLNVVVLLSLGAALSGCSALSAVTGHYSDSFGPNWGGMSSETSADSLTVQRIRNRGPGEAPSPLTPEPGDVWPREEGPRATLANPDEALRGVRPTESEQQP